MFSTIYNIDSTLFDIYDYKFNNSRWIHDGNLNSNFGHVEFPLDNNIKPGFLIKINNISFNILNIIGDGTLPFSIELSNFSYTGRINSITNVQTTNGISLNSSNVDNDFFGTSQNDVTITSNTIINSYYYLLSTANIGATNLQLNSTSGLNINDEILIYQTQDVSGTYGNFQLNIIDSINGAYITLKFPLIFTFKSGRFNTTSAYNSQVIKVPNYRNLTVNSGISISASSWSGYSGGVVALRVSDTLTINGTINANSVGFRGGASNTTGEGYNGLAGGGGGGATCTHCDLSWTGGYGNGGGGGPNITPADFSKIIFGCGGGGGGGHPNSSDNPGGAGGRGAGVVFIFAKNIVNNGNIYCNASNGTAGVSRSLWSVTWYSGGGGGGGGGSIYICCKTLTNSSNIGTNRGLGAAGGRSGSAGAYGKIFVYYEMKIGNDPINSYNYNNNGVVNYYIPNQGYITTDFMIFDYFDYISNIAVNIDTSIVHYWYTLLYLLSFDNGLTWQYYRNSQWNICDVSDFYNYGMTTNELNSLTPSQLNIFPTFKNSNVKIAVYLYTSNSSVTPKLNNVIITTKSIPIHIIKRCRQQTINNIQICNITNIY